MTKFDPTNKEHRIIALAAIAAADALGVGRITAVREQLELNDIRITNIDAFNRFVLEIGGAL